MGLAIVILVRGKRGVGSTVGNRCIRRDIYPYGPVCKLDIFLLQFSEGAGTCT